jgi:hypothetical protein
MSAGTRGAKDQSRRESLFQHAREVVLADIWTNLPVTNDALLLIFGFRANPNAPESSE